MSAGAPLKILVVAAEASADHHAAQVLGTLRERGEPFEAFGIAGPALRALGVEAIARAEEISVMGLSEVLRAFPRIWRIAGRVTDAARARRPDVALLVDSPDLNLRLAKRFKRLGIPVLYFIGPTIWAWRPGRAKTVARWVDEMCVILPFEEAAYAARGVKVHYVGNPLIDALPPDIADAGLPERDPARRATLGFEEGPVLALLPGSRPNELARLLGPMLEAAAALRRARPELQLVIPVAPTLRAEPIEAALKAAGLEAKLTEGRALEALRAADLALVASGTATLEAALALRPMVVVYRVSWLTWTLFRRLVRTAHFALVNLIAGRRLAPELIQGELRPQAVADALQPLLPGGAGRAQALEGLREVRQRLGGPGAAGRVVERLLGLARRAGGEDDREG